MLEPKLEGNRGLITFNLQVRKSKPTRTKLASFTLQREPCVHYHGQASTGLVNEQTRARKKSTCGYKTLRVGAWGFSSNKYNAGKLLVTSSQEKAGQTNNTALLSTIRKWVTGQTNPQNLERGETKRVTAKICSPGESTEATAYRNNCMVIFMNCWRLSLN